MSESDRKVPPAEVCYCGTKHLFYVSCEQNRRNQEARELAKVIARREILNPNTSERMRNHLMDRLVDLEAGRG